jgi:hypothetical protein
MRPGATGAPEPFFIADKFYLSLGLLSAGGLWAWLGWWGIAHYQGGSSLPLS